MNATITKQLRSSWRRRGMSFPPHTTFDGRGLHLQLRKLPIQTDSSPDASAIYLTSTIRTLAYAQGDREGDKSRWVHVLVRENVSTNSILLPYVKKTLSSFSQVDFLETWSTRCSIGCLPLKRRPSGTMLSSTCSLNWSKLIFWMMIIDKLIGNCTNPASYHPKQFSWYHTTKSLFLQEILLPSAWSVQYVVALASTKFKKRHGTDEQPKAMCGEPRRWHRVPTRDIQVWNPVFTESFNIFQTQKALLSIQLLWRSGHRIFWEWLPQEYQHWTNCTCGRKKALLIRLMGIQHRQHTISMMRMILNLSTITRVANCDQDISNWLESEGMCWEIHRCASW